jgi:hypothetical protein|tara:strand:- start:2599 stop:2814 length:216 start_codon:yes stop_codon:yes gene_type:complete
LDEQKVTLKGKGMENLVIAAILAAMIHGHITGGEKHEKQEIVKDDINWELAGNFRTESTPNNVQWVIITDE